MIRKELKMTTLFFIPPIKNKANSFGQLVEKCYLCTKKEASMENNYQVFIASSLELKEHRQAAEEAIKDANCNSVVKELGIQFNAYLYEKDPFMNQKLERNDAQDCVDEQVKRSTLFFVIIDGVIRNKTLHEFLIAKEQFKRGKLPQHIIICNNKSLNEKNDDENCGDGMTYQRFMKEIGLISNKLDLNNQIVQYSHIYPIPYESIDELKSKINWELLRFARSEERPLSGAVRGFELTEDDFFTDDNRKKKCSKVYLRREFDDLLDNAIRNYNFVVLVGFSLAGKTRAVMEAMRAVEDGWVYVVKRGKAVDDLQRLSNYIGHKEHCKLYIVLDNLDQWLGDNCVTNALKELLGLIDGKHDVIIGTASSKNHDIPGGNKAEWIEIKEMDEREFAEARDFLVSVGAQPDERNLRYRRTGALFVDLEDIKSYYNTWLNKDDEKDLLKLAKRALLKTFKALSIWRDDNMGNRGLMENMSTWFCSRDMDRALLYKNCSWTEADITEGHKALYACKGALESLVQMGQMGVSSIGDGNLIIVQEYIYRYFLDYDGTLLKDEKAASFEKEKVLVKEVLLYCSENPNGEALTTQVSRLCRRCSIENKKAIVSWLYGLWSGIDEVEESDIILSDILKNDREKCEKTDEKKIKHLYSNLVEKYITNCCDTMDDALSAYNRCPKDKRTDHLFSALMQKGKSSQERDYIRNLSDYQDMCDQPYVIAVEMEWADNYRKAKDWITHFIFYQHREKPQEMVKCLLSDDEEVPYTLFQLRRAVDTLALKVANPEEFDDFCGVIRDFYLCLGDDTKLLNKIRRKLPLDNSKAYNSKYLTLIDLLAVMPSNVLKGLLGNVFGGDFVASKNLIDNLIQSVGETLTKRLTNEMSLRLTVGYVASLLIRKLSTIPYDDVYEGLFKPLKIKYENKLLILRNIYTYTAMLGNSSCNGSKVDNLLKEDLIPHVQGTGDNLLTINTFTLNKIMKKSKGKNKRLHVRRIDSMYDRLGIPRDTFTYCSLISTSKSLLEGIRFLNEMQKQKLEPNIFVLGELMKLKYVSLNKALTMVVDPPVVHIPGEYKLGDFELVDGFDPNKIVAQLQGAMSDSYLAWGNLFQKPCRRTGEKDVLEACLSYLEKEKPKLLEGGFIYNCLIANKDFLFSVIDVKNFVVLKMKRGFRPNSYTIRHVIDRIIELNGDVERRKAIDRLNELIEMVMDGKTCKLDEFVVNYRLRIYKNWTDGLKMDFYDERGEKIKRKIQKYSEKKMEVAYSASGYLIAMHIMGYPVNMSLVKKNLTFAEDFPIKLLEELPFLKEPLSPSEKNELLLRLFKEGKITSVEEAIKGLKWTNTSATIGIFTSMLNHYIVSQPKTPILFSTVMSYYDTWIKKEGRIPTTITLSVISEATTCWGDMLNLLTEFRELRKKDPDLSLSPHMLTAMSKYAGTVQELMDWTDVMLNEGCPSSSKAADAYIFRMVRYMLVHDSDETACILNSLCQYIMEGNNVEVNVLMQAKWSKLMLDLYQNPRNVSASLLRTLIYYNATEMHRYNVDEMMECVISHNHCIVPLIEMLVADVTNNVSFLPLREDMDSETAKNIAEDFAQQYVPQLFSRIKWNSRPLSSGLLFYLAKNLQPANAQQPISLNNYRNFMKQLYKMDCIEIEGTVPGLIQFLKNYLANQTGNSADMVKARKTLAQILVYSRLNKLRNGHLLLEKIEDKYVTWCSHVMNHKEILVDKDSPSWSDSIKYHTDKLDDGYPCSLNICKKHIKKESPLDDELKVIIKQQEKYYAHRIEMGEVHLKDVLALPAMWLEAGGWSPSEILVMAMIRRISQMAYNPNPSNIYNIDNYIKDAQSRCEEIVECYKNASDSKYVYLFYWILGRNVPQSCTITYRISLSAIKALMYDVILDRKAYFCANGTSITKKDCNKLRFIEECCAGFIEKNGSEMAWLLQLPERWKKIKVKDDNIHVWRPCQRMVLAMLKSYVRIADREGEDASIAREYISQVKEAMLHAREGKYRNALIKYSMLGVTKNEGDYIVVPLSDLKQVIKND